MPVWKDHTAEGALTGAGEAMKAIRPTGIPAGEHCVQVLCMTSQDLWQKQSREITKETVHVTVKVGGEGFRDTDLGEIYQLTDSSPEGLTEDDLMETSASEPPADYKEDDLTEAGTENWMTSDSLARASNYSRLLLTLLMTQTLVWYKHWNEIVEEGSVPHRNTVREVKKQKDRNDHVFS